MPPPHLAVLNAQDPDDKPARPRLGWLRAAVAAPDKPSRVPALLRRAAKPGAAPETAAPAPTAAAPEPLAREAAAAPSPPPPVEPMLAEPRLAEPSLAEPSVAEPSLVQPTRVEPPLVEPPLVQPLPAEPAPAQPPPALRQSPPPPAPPSRPRPAAIPAEAARHIPHPPRPAPPQEDLLADLPPAQVPLRPRASPIPAAAAEPPPRPAAAERAFRVGRQGGRPAHAMSAVEIAAWREGAMEAGRARDPIIGRPRLWWWLALSAVLVLPIAYAGSWLGMAGNGAEFLSTRLGQEAWIMLGGPEASVIYWVVIYALAMLLQMARPLEPVLILGAATWWGWTGLHAAWVAGWLAQRIPPMPMP